MDDGFTRAILRSAAVTVGILLVPGCAGDSGLDRPGAGLSEDEQVVEARAAEAQAEDPLRAYFGAQPTPELAWARFLELNRRRIKDADLGIYDEKARQLAERTNGGAGQAHIARLYADAQHTIRVSGDRAAAVFLDDPNHTLAPWFFHRTEVGWQLDGGMYPDVIGYNDKNQWRFRRLDHPYMFAFSDFRFDRNGFAFYGAP